MAKINALLKLNSNTALAGSAFLNFIDEYEYQGSSTYENALTFTAAMVNTNGQIGVDTIIVSMLNSTTNDTGSFNYKIKVLG